MNRRLFCLSGAASAARMEPLDAVRRGHPRLLLLDDALPHLRTLVQTGGLAGAVHSRLVEAAQRILQSPPVEYKLIGPRLLDKSRTALDRVYTLALLWRLDGRRDCFERALLELRAAAAFQDWNPSHFLDTAEMTHAFAVGYDWLYPALAEKDRAWLREAIVVKGLEPGLNFYENRRGWVNARHNWNQVCNGGMLLGALAIAEDEPARAGRILRAGLQSLPLAMASYGPDGGWNEGPGYWHYATRYNVYLLAGLETAAGSDFGLSEAPGFSRAGHFRVDFCSPTGKTFNYADSGDSAGPAEEMFWLARRFAQPVYAWHERRMLEQSNRAHALHLVWFPGHAASVSDAGWPLDAYYEGVQVAFLRGSWADPNCIWVAVKGGDNKANHSHLDLGSFVLDAQGERWATDFGGDDYNLPGYFGAQRWNYYRLRTESHNTVLVDGQNQHPKAEARLHEKHFTADGSRVVFDLTAAYSGLLQKHFRGVEMIGRRAVTITDELECSQPAELLWGMVTPADIRLQGRQADLSRNGKRLRASLASDGDARFDVVSTQPPPPQNQNDATRKLVVRLAARVKRARIAVRFEPV